MYTSSILLVACVALPILAAPLEMPNILRGTISQKLVDAVESIQKEVGSVSVARVAGDLENPVVAERAWSKDELKVLFKAAGTRTAVKGSAEEQAQIYAKNKVASLQNIYTDMAKSKDIRVSEKGKVLLRKFNKAKASLPYKDLGLMAGAGAVGGITAAGVMKHHQHKHNATETATVEDSASPVQAATVVELDPSSATPPVLAAAAAKRSLEQLD